jgi:hypothetical protein
MKVRLTSLVPYKAPILLSTNKVGESNDAGVQIDPLEVHPACAALVISEPTSHPVPSEYHPLPFLHLTD